MFRLRAALASRLRLHLVPVMSRNQLDHFLRLLKKSPSGAVFNPWWEVDAQNDIGPNAPVIRRKQLSLYLRERLGNARLAIIGEALGNRGGHRPPLQILSGFKPRRTSKPSICPDGFSEPTASIVWGALLRLGVKPD